MIYQNHMSSILQKCPSLYVLQFYTTRGDYIPNPIHWIQSAKPNQLNDPRGTKGVVQGWLAGKRTTRSIRTLGSRAHGNHTSGSRTRGCPTHASQFFSKVVSEWMEMGVRTGLGGDCVADGWWDGAWSGVDGRAVGACRYAWLPCPATWELVS